MCGFSPTVENPETKLPCISSVEMETEFWQLSKRIPHILGNSTVGGHQRFSFPSQNSSSWNSQRSSVCDADKNGPHTTSFAKETDRHTNQLHLYSFAAFSNLWGGGRFSEFLLECIYYAGVCFSLPPTPLCMCVSEYPSYLSSVDKTTLIATVWV